MADCDSTRTFNDETIACIREALLIGLSSYGEIERLSAAQGILAQRGKPVAEGLRVIHPTGSADTVIRLAEALWMVCTDSVLSSFPVAYLLRLAVSKCAAGDHQAVKEHAAGRG